MVSDSEPRYRLVDSNDNVVGALYAQGDGTLAIQEGTSGSDNEVTVDTDGTFNAPAVSTGSLEIGGKLYEEDDNSPISVSSQSSVSYTVAGDYDTIIILSDFATTGYNILQVNNDTGPNYETVALDASTTSGQTEWSIPRANTRPWIQIYDVGTRLRFSVPPCANSATQSVTGENSNLGGNGIDSITLADSGSVDRNLTARVYGRVI